MSYRYYNPNPDGLRVGDCVIRSLTIALNRSWKDVYIELAVRGLRLSDMPSANRVWQSLLSDSGFIRKAINQQSCPACFLVKHFCIEHPEGTYVLCTGTHTVAVKDGDYYDTWDSGNEVPVFYWEKV